MDWSANTDWSVQSATSLLHILLKQKRGRGREEKIGEVIEARAGEAMILSMTLCSYRPNDHNAEGKLIYVLPEALGM